MSCGSQRPVTLALGGPTPSFDLHILTTDIGHTPSKGCVTVAEGSMLEPQRLPVVEIFGLIFLCEKWTNNAWHIVVLRRKGR